jgi:hypothetical protein
MQARGFLDKMNYWWDLKEDSAIDIASKLARQWLPALDYLMAFLCTG